jgi:hypothetical protein
VSGEALEQSAPVGLGSYQKWAVFARSGAWPEKGLRDEKPLKFRENLSEPAVLVCIEVPVLPRDGAKSSNHACSVA